MIREMETRGLYSFCNETIVMMGSGILVIRTTLKISLKTPLIKVLKIGHNGTATKAHLFPCHCTNRICSKRPETCDKRALQHQNSSNYIMKIVKTNLHIKNIEDICNAVKYSFYFYTRRPRSLDISYIFQHSTCQMSANDLVSWRHSSGTSIWN